MTDIAARLTKLQANLAKARDNHEKAKSHLIDEHIFKLIESNATEGKITSRVNIDAMRKRGVDPIDVYEWFKKHNLRDTIEIQGGTCLSDDDADDYTFTVKCYAPNPILFQDY